MAAIHHTSIVVSDIQRSADFYIEVLDGRWLVEPISIGAPGASQYMGGPEELEFELAMVGIGDTFLELFRFDAAVAPPWLRAGSPRVPHTGFQVDDVEETMQRALAAGATPVWEEIQSWGKGLVVYLADPDLNVFEITDLTPAALIEETLGMFPDSAPGPGGSGGASAVG